MDDIEFVYSGEFRLDKGHPDAYYELIKSCTEQSWYAINKNYFSSAIFPMGMCLGDLSFWVTDVDGIPLINCNEIHSPFLTYHWLKGSNESKIEQIQFLLNKGEAVYIFTNDYKISISRYYGRTPQDDVKGGHGHVIVLLGQLKNDYIYFHSRSNRSVNYRPFQNNPQLGCISKNDFHEILKEKVDACVCEYKMDICTEDIDKYVDKLISDFVGNYRRSMKENNLVGYRGLTVVDDTLKRDELILFKSCPGISYITIADYYAWKCKEIGGRRQLMGEWLKYKNLKDCATELISNGELWNSLGRLFEYTELKRSLDKLESISRILNLLLCAERDAIIKLERLK